MGFVKGARDDDRVVVVASAHTTRAYDAIFLSEPSHVVFYELLLALLRVLTLEGKRLSSLALLEVVEEHCADSYEEEGVEDDEEDKGHGSQEAVFVAIL